MTKKNKLNCFWAQSYRVCIFVLVIGVVAFLGGRPWDTQRSNVIMLMHSWHTPWRIVVLESDDWGMHGLSAESLEVVSRRLSARQFLIPLTYQKRMHYLRDATESPEDLERLYKVLEQHQDSLGRHPVFTANIIVTNPDFKAIKREGFKQYFYKMPAEALRLKWLEGISRKVFFPQYHGYAHINIKNWLSDLKNNEPLLRSLFDLAIVRLPDFSMQGRSYDYMAEYVDMSTTPSTQLTMETQQQKITDGLKIFKNIFDYAPLSTIAPFYVWDTATEKAWAEGGIRYIQGADQQVYGKDSSGQKLRSARLLGSRNDLGHYSVMLFILSRMMCAQ